MDSFKEQLTKLAASSKEIRNKLDNLTTRIEVPDIGKEAKKLLPDTEEISKKIKTLEADANTLVASANSKIEDLKGLTDKISQKALAEAEEALAEAKQVLSDIQARIPLIDQVKEKATNAVQSAQTGRGKFTGWIGNQWNSFWDFKSWSTTPWWQTASRGTAIAGTGILAGWGISKGRSKVKSWWSNLWNSDKEEVGDKTEESIWDEYDDDGLREYIKGKLPKGKAIPPKVKTREQLVAFAKKKGIIPPKDEEGTLPLAA